MELGLLDATCEAHEVAASSGTWHMMMRLPPLRMLAMLVLPYLYETYMLYVHMGEVSRKLGDQNRQLLRV